MSAGDNSQSFSMDTIESKMNGLQLSSLERADEYRDLALQEYKLYTSQGRLVNIQTAVSLQSRGLLERTGNNQVGSDLASDLNYFGSFLHTLYERLGRLEHLEDAIRVTRFAVEITPKDEDRLNAASTLNNLGNMLEHRFKRLGRLDDLEEAIQVTRRTFKIAPEDATSKARRLSNLGSRLETRFERLGKLDDLEEAILVARRAVEITPEDGAYMADHLNNLGNKLENRFRRLGTLEDLKEAVRVARRAVEMTPKDDLSLPGRLNNLGNRLRRRFDQFGRLNDLEEAIQVTRYAVEKTPEDSSTLAIYLGNFGSMLKGRFECLGRLDDLEESIQVTRRVVKITPKDSFMQLADRLSNLGGSLRKRFGRLGRLDDLEEAIQVTRRAVNITPDDNLMDMAGRLNNLGNLLSTRFKLSTCFKLSTRFKLSTLFKERLNDLEEAIQLSRRSVKLTPGDSLMNMGLYLDNLGHKLGQRFEQLGRLEDLEEAIHVIRRAVEITHKDTIDMISYLTHLGDKLERRSKLTSSSDDETEAIFAFEQAWKIRDAFPLFRLRAAIACIKLLKDRQRFQQAYEMANESLKLLPIISTRALSRDDQQDIIANFSGLAADACALRLECKNDDVQDAQDALEMLELGRGAMLGMALEDRADTADLRASWPQHASQLDDLRAMLAVSISSQGGSSDGRRTTLSPVKVLQDFQDCVDEIRSLPDFDNFMKPPSSEEMKKAAEGGAIVVVNVSDVRSDAIIITPQSIRSLSLRSMKYSKVHSWLAAINTGLSGSYTPEEIGARQRTYRHFLRWLWRCCVRPITTELGYGEGKSYEHLPRVWWIGTAVASSLPFHAAGEHYRGSKSTTLHVAISSHTPTIRALIHAKSRASSEYDSLSLDGQYSLLMATMKTTPGRTESLHSVPEEAKAIRNILDSNVEITLKEQPDAQTILDLMPGYDMFHFAGHGISDRAYPTNSRLVLEKGEANSTSELSVQDPLMVKQLFDINLQPALLAFLSACSTAESQSRRLADESIHLASGFLVAGFRHVVASLWPSEDSVCKDVATEFYRHLHITKGRTVKDEDFVRALHAAILGIYQYLWDSPLLWAQYVHIGA